jgi:hypothetical protein
VHPRKFVQKQIEKEKEDHEVKKNLEKRVDGLGKKI